MRPWSGAETPGEQLDLFLVAARGSGVTLSAAEVHELGARLVEAVDDPEGCPAAVWHAGTYLLLHAEEHPEALGADVFYRRYGLPAVATAVAASFKRGDFPAGLGCVPAEFLPSRGLDGLADGDVLRDALGGLEPEALSANPENFRDAGPDLRRAAASFLDHAPEWGLPPEARARLAASLLLGTPSDAPERADSLRAFLDALAGSDRHASLWYSLRVARGEDEALWEEPRYADSLPRVLRTAADLADQGEAVGQIAELLGEEFLLEAGAESSGLGFLLPFGLAGWWLCAHLGREEGAYAAWRLVGALAERYGALSRALSSGIEAGLTGGGASGGERVAAELRQVMEELDTELRLERGYRGVGLARQIHADNVREVFAPLRDALDDPLENPAEIGAKVRALNAEKLVDDHPEQKRHPYPIIAALRVQLITDRAKIVDTLLEAVALRERLDGFGGRNGGAGALHPLEGEAGREAELLTESHPETAWAVARFLQGEPPDPTAVPMQPGRVSAALLAAEGVSYPGPDAGPFLEWCARDAAGVPQPKRAGASSRLARSAAGSVKTAATAPRDLAPATAEDLRRYLSASAPTPEPSRPAVGTPARPAPPSRSPVASPGNTPVTAPIATDGARAAQSARAASANEVTRDASPAAVPAGTDPIAQPAERDLGAAEPRSSAAPASVPPAPASVPSAPGAGEDGQGGDEASPAPAAEEMAAQPAAATGIALFVDWENLKYALRNLAGREAPDIGALVEVVRGYGPLLVCKAYADWAAYDHAQEFDARRLYNAGIEPVYVPTRTRNGPTPAGGQLIPNSVDVKMAVDCVETLFTRPEIGTYVLVSGDHSSMHVLGALAGRGKRTIVIGVEGGTARALGQRADQLILYHDLFRTEQAPAPSSTATPPPSVAPPPSEPPVPTENPAAAPPPGDVARTPVPVAASPHVNGGVAASPVDNRRSSVYQDIVQTLEELEHRYEYVTPRKLSYSVWGKGHRQAYELPSGLTPVSETVRAMEEWEIHEWVSSALRDGVIENDTGASAAYGRLCVRLRGGRLSRVRRETTPPTAETPAAPATETLDSSAGDGPPSTGTENPSQIGAEDISAPSAGGVHR